MGEDIRMMDRTEILIAIGLFFVFVILAFVLARFITKKLSQYADKTETTADDVIIDRIRLPIYISIILIGIRLAVIRVSELAAYLTVLDKTFYIVWMISGGFLAYELTSLAIHFFGERLEIPKTASHALRNFSRWIFLMLIVFGISKITGIDLGGIIPTLMLILGTLIFLSFAAWSMLGNVTAGFVIMIWRPFEIGHIVEIMPDGYTGEIINVNLMFTSIKTDIGARLSIPNAIILQKVVRNQMRDGKQIFEMRYPIEITNLKSMKQKLIKALEVTEGISKTPTSIIEIQDVDGENIILKLIGYIDVPSKRSEILSNFRENLIKQG